EPLLALCALFSLIYIPFLLFSASFVENTPLDWRLLSPVCVTALIAMAALATRSWQAAVRVPERVARRIVGVGLGALLVAYAAGSTIWVANSFENGRGYASRFWTESRTLSAFRMLAPNGYVV